MANRRWRRSRSGAATFLAVGVLVVAGAGCGAPAERPTPAVSGAPATWQLRPGQQLYPASTSFVAMVTRSECNSGVTGEVLPPRVEIRESEVVVTFSVAPRGTGAADCQGNAAVAYTVDLEEPLGRRSLVDGQCLPGGAATRTAECVPDGTRHRP